MSSQNSFIPGPRLSECLASAINHSGSMLRATVERSSTVMLLRVGGEIDAANRDAWQCLVDEVAAATTAPGLLVVDTSGMDFMASVAFRVLIEQSARCRVRGITLCLVSNQPIVARIMGAAWAGVELPFYQSVDAALHDYRPSQLSRH